MRYLMAPLQGEEELWVVFWIYGVLVYVIAWSIQIPLMLNPPTLSPFMTSAVAWANGIIGYSYTIWVNIGLWRCAFNTESKSTPHAIRFGVVITLLFTFYSIYSDLTETPDPTAETTGIDTEALKKSLEILQNQR